MRRGRKKAMENTAPRESSLVDTGIVSATILLTYDVPNNNQRDQLRDKARTIVTNENGLFIRLQQSVYVIKASSPEGIRRIAGEIDQIIPKVSDVRMVPITEQQFEHLKPRDNNGIIGEQKTAEEQRSMEDLGVDSWPANPFTAVPQPITRPPKKTQEQPMELFNFTNSKNSRQPAIVH